MWSVQFAGCFAPERSKSVYWPQVVVHREGRGYFWGHFVIRKMSSTVSRRNSCRGSQCGNRASFDCHVRRRGSSCSYFSPGAQTEEFSVSLSQPIFTITLRFLLAIDLWLSKRLGVCASEESALGSIRPLVRLVEFSGHVVPWFIGTVYTLLGAETVAEQEIMLNLALGEWLCAHSCEFGESRMSSTMLSRPDSFRFRSI